MLPMPWKSFAAPRDDKEYVALLSFLPLKRYGKIPKFARLTMETMGQLAQSHGLIGYSLGAELIRKRFWTLSVWEDQQSLRILSRRFRTAGSCRTSRHTWARRNSRSGRSEPRRFRSRGRQPGSTC